MRSHPDRKRGTASAIYQSGLENTHMELVEARSRRASRRRPDLAGQYHTGPALPARDLSEQTTHQRDLRYHRHSGRPLPAARCPLPGRSIHTGHRHHLVTSGPERTVSDRSGRERRFLRNHCTLIFSPWIGAKRHEQHTARRHQSYF